MGPDASLLVGTLREADVVVDGQLTIVANGGDAGTASVSTVSVGEFGRIDLSDNKLIARSMSIGSFNAAGGKYSGVQGMVQGGRNGGTWDGSGGIVTSQADALSGLTTLAVATAEMVGRDNFGGQSVAGDDVLVMYTYAGDANLDGIASGDDYSMIDFNIAVAGASGYANGDFNYDGIISGDDYSLIDFNIVAQGAPFLTSGGPELSMSAFEVNGAGGVVAVPEPASIAAAAMLVTLCARRSRRRRRRSNHVPHNP